ncbi:regulatory protein GemA, partial [Methylomonas sp. SURF-1]
MNGAQPRAFDRTKFLQLLAIGKTQLQFDDEFYRCIWLPQQGATKDKDGRYSATTLSNTQLFKAVEEMKRLGFKVQSKNATKKPRKGHRRQADDAQSKMIRGLWIELHQLGEVRDPSEAALAKWVSGQVKSSKGAEALQWLDGHQAGRVIEQLKKWRDRVLAKRRQ